MAGVWFALLVMIAVVCLVFAIIVHVHSGGAREFAAEMRGPRDAASGEGEEAEAAAA